MKLRKNILCGAAIAALVFASQAQAVTTADVVVLIDESGSMSGEQAWVPGMISSLDSSLIGAGVTGNRFGLVGFGGPAHGATSSYDPHKHLFSGGDWSSSGDFGSPDISLATSGGIEDGLQAIAYALGAYSFRGAAAVNFVLIADEARISNSTNDRTGGTVTPGTLLPQLKSLNILLNNINNYSYNGNSALGHDSDGNAYFADGVGGYTTGAASGAPLSGSSRFEYHDLALGTGGASWDLSYLRSGGLNADSFTAAFVDIKVGEILEQEPTDDPNRVPDTGSTVLLFVSGLAGIGFLRRRLAA